MFENSVGPPVYRNESEITRSTHRLDIPAPQRGEQGDENRMRDALSDQVGFASPPRHLPVGLLIPQGDDAHHSGSCVSPAHPQRRQNEASPTWLVQREDSLMDDSPQI